VESKIEVTVTIADKQVTLAGPESFVRAEVQRLTNMIAERTSGSPHTEIRSGAASARNELSETERGFIAAKQPSGHAETVAVLAYFLTKNGQAEFMPDDIRRAYARAGARPPKVIAQALRDAKNLHDYLEAGTEKGTFRLSHHGERTVEFDLPKKKSD
jgi:hypothetical protein